MCEFDFSSYPYYYNYPDSHLSLEEQDVQMVFAKEAIKVVKDASFLLT